nr:hypothetical protein CFP56_57011 [Quercus suber]
MSSEREHEVASKFGGGCRTQSRTVEPMLLIGRWTTSDRRDLHAAAKASPASGDLIYSTLIVDVSCIDARHETHALGLEAGPNFGAERSHHLSW